MAVYNACYATREEILRALDIKLTTIDLLRIDRANEAAREDIDALCHRRFYNKIETRYFDWPNYQYSYPWRIWLDGSELADVTTNVPVVVTGSSTIPSSQIFWKPWNYGPPFTAIELNRSTTAAFGVATTPQRSVQITGTFGYWIKTTAAGNLAAAMTDTTSTTITVTNSTAIGVGDVLTIGSEQLLVQDRAWVTSGQTQSSGCTTTSAADNALTPNGGTFYVGETLLLDSEQMLITDISGSVLTVKRAWNGSVLATHSGATIYTQRSLTVTRGDFGTTAATHLNNAAISINVVPQLIKDLAIAEALNIILQETSGYSHNVGESGASQAGTGGELPAMRDQVYARFGRKSRRRVI